MLADFAAMAAIIMEGNLIIRAKKKKIK